MEQKDLEGFAPEANTWEVASLFDAVEKLRNVGARLGVVESARVLGLVAAQIENVAQSIKDWPLLKAVTEGNRQTPSNPPVTPPGHPGDKEDTAP